MAQVIDLPLPGEVGKKTPHVVAMVHVPSTTSILNHAYTPLLGVATPTIPEIQELSEIVDLLSTFAKTAKIALVEQVAPISTKIRSAVFFYPETKVLVNRFESLPFVRALIDRALSEVETYTKCGITCVEIENVAAPYFVGSGFCPWEELLAINVVTGAVRRAHPAISIGVHILSCNELEALPIAVLHGCMFIRSEATLFAGLRPEGETNNNGNLARFFYLRHVLRSLFPGQLLTSPSGLDSMHFPQLWSDIKKKHTVFIKELDDIDTWLHNITFAKLEGVIVTGAETGSDVDEASLAKTRAAVDKCKLWNKQQFGSHGTSTNPLPPLPVVTGSGLNFEMYAKYADFMIVGTAFKRGAYWENEVDENSVLGVLERLRIVEESRSS